MQTPQIESYKLTKFAGGIRGVPTGSSPSRVFTLQGLFLRRLPCGVWSSPSGVFILRGLRPAVSTPDEAYPVYFFCLVQIRDPFPRGLLCGIYTLRKTNPPGCSPYGVYSAGSMPEEAYLTESSPSPYGVSPAGSAAEEAYLTGSSPSGVFTLRGLPCGVYARRGLPYGLRGLRLKPYARRDLPSGVFTLRGLHTGSTLRGLVYGGYSQWSTLSGLSPQWPTPPTGFTLRPNDGARRPACSDLV